MSRLTGYALLLQACFLGATHAAEIPSNGVGGGPWTDPATWRGKKVPGPDDDVVVQKNDVVVFDRQADDKPACRKLLIDPKGGLTFKTGAGKLALGVTEGIESFGVIRLDGTRSAGDDFELRLLGDTAAKRNVKLAKGSALLLYGRAELPKDRRNVALIAPQAQDATEPLAGLVDADGVVMIDWQRANVQDVKLIARKLDNTGAKPNERIKVSECRFTGVGRIMCQTCDTPEILKNSFEHAGLKPLEEAAINVSYSPLAEIAGNVIRGGFAIGITINYQGDSVVVNNTIEKCGTGIQGGYGIPNTMIKQATIRDCGIGVKLEGASGVLEDVTVEGATTAFHQQNANLQLTSFTAKDVAKKGNPVLQEGGTLGLLNCNLAPEQIKFTPSAPVAGKPVAVVTCLQYLIVGAKDAPPGSLIEVRSQPAPPAGAADPNVRNSPAPLINALTPLPKTLAPLMIKAWTIDAAGKLQPAPEYIVTILGPAAKEGADRPVLKMTTYRPMGTVVRALPDDRTPTLEVSVK